MTTTQINRIRQIQKEIEYIVNRLSLYKDYDYLNPKSPQYLLHDLKLWTETLETIESELANGCDDRCDCCDQDC